MFSVSPSAERIAMALSTASGIDVAMITVERQEPRKTRIIRLVRAAAMAPSRTTPLTAAVTKIDWSPMRAMRIEGGTSARSCSTFALTPLMIDRVDVAPFFRTCISTERDPSTWTTLICGALPSRTRATSRM